MKIQIEKVRKKNKKSSDKFAKIEWKKFNKERGYAFREKEYSFIAKEGKKVMGFISFKILGGVAYLSQIIVSKTTRGKGIGKRLIKKFESIARNKKCHLAYLETSERHKEALKFYKKNNYKTIITLKNNKFHFTWYILEKRLK